MQTGNQFSSFNHVQQDHQHLYNDIFKQLLINPGRLNEEQMSQLQLLVDRFPQMGLLHALQARYSGDTAHLNRAAAGFADSAVLQKIVLRTSGLPAVNESQIIFRNNDTATETVAPAEAATEVVEEVQPQLIQAEPVTEVVEQPVEDNTSPRSATEVSEELPAELSEVTPIEPVTEPELVVEEQSAEHTLVAESEPVAEEQPVEQVEVSPIKPDIEPETVTEEQPAEQAEEKASPVGETLPVAEEVPQVEPEIKAQEETEDAPASELPVSVTAPLPETQQLIIENIAANDYFVFDTAFIDRNKIVVDEVKQKEAEPEPTVAEEGTAAHTEEGQVTRYHDDKMPYSFLWWLDKTRSKHSAIYQPYVMNKPAAAVPVEEKVEPVAEVPEERKKEDEILERFLQEDPQIKPPTGDKLDNENKARQSSEDQDEMITETLARIYADQMLYSKAIAAYKILILKNPEKRRYFANQIEILQKKIN